MADRNRRLHDRPGSRRYAHQARLLHPRSAGIDADIVNEDGEPVTEPDRGGYLVIRRPWPSMLRTIWGDNPRYLKTYWEKFQNRLYVAGDGAHRDADGYFWIMGRIDDVLKVSGHRLGTMEVESALVAHPRVAEAAVVGRPHDIKARRFLPTWYVAASARWARMPRSWPSNFASGSASSSAPSPSPMTSASPRCCPRRARKDHAPAATCPGSR